MNRHRRKPVSLLPRSTGSAPLPRQRLVVLIERVFYTRARDLQARVFHIDAEERVKGLVLDFPSHPGLTEPGPLGRDPRQTHGGSGAPRVADLTRLRPCVNRSDLQRKPGWLTRKNPKS